MVASRVVNASDFVETAIATSCSSTSVTLSTGLNSPQKNTQSSFKSAARTVILKQKVVKAFNGGGCASSDPLPVMTPIDISSSALDDNVNIFKKVCSTLFDKVWSALKDEFKKEEKKGEKKDGKRKRDKSDSD